MRFAMTAVHPLAAAGGAQRNSIITNFFNSPEYHNRFLP